MVITGIQQAIKSEELRRSGRCFVSGSYVHTVIVIVMLWSLSPTCGSKPVQPGIQICPIPSKSHCALEDNVTHSIDMKGSAASDRETEGGNSISPRILEPVPRPLPQAQRPRPCFWAVQSQLPGEPSSRSSLAPHPPT